MQVNTKANYISRTLLIIVMIVFLSCCKEQDNEKKSGLNILCTIYPIWLLTANVVGDTEGVNLDLLLPADASPHSTGLGVRDMRRISEADIIIMNGFNIEIEKPIFDVISQENTEAKRIIVSNGVEPLFFGEESEDAGHEENGDEHTVHLHKQGALDPHTWVSPKQAIILVRNIRDGLIDGDSKNAEKYKANADAFIKQIEALVTEFEKASKEFKKRNIVTGHMAFGYLARDFGINIIAVIEIIPQQEPSASELLKMAEKIKITGAAAIFTEPLVRSSVAETLGEAAGIPVRTLNPCQMGEIDAGEYIRNMRKNLEELKDALM